MPAVPGLRSPYTKVGRLVYFGRMLDKIRLHAAGRLPPEYVTNLGDRAGTNFFDARCCRFLGVKYADLAARVLAGEADEAVLAWAEKHGRAHSDEECQVWNQFMMKCGFRDGIAETLARRIKQSALEAAPIMTMFDYLDFDEGRDPVSIRAWEQK